MCSSDLRRFAREWNLDGAKGGGVHMWREVWDDDVSHIYRDVLGKLFFFFLSCFSNSPDLMALSHTTSFFNRHGGTCVWSPTKSGCIC